MGTNHDKPKRFANPKPLNLNTRIFHGIFQGGVTVREVDAAIRKFWGKKFFGANLNDASFYLVSGVTTEGHNFELRLNFNAGTPADSDPDLIACQTSSSDGPFKFFIERRDQGYVRRIALADGVELEDQTAEKAFDLLPAIISGALWTKRGPFGPEDPEENLALRLL